VKVRIFAHLEECEEFLRETEYPFAADWTLQYLMSCIVLQVLTEQDEVVGYVWMHWMEDHDRYLELHAHVRKDWRGRWMQPAVVADLMKVAELCGARFIVCRALSHNVHKTLSKIGFVRDPGSIHYYLCIARNYFNGKSKKEAPPETRAAASGGSAHAGQEPV
jgi:hypothetical protein